MQVYVLCHRSMTSLYSSLWIERAMKLNIKYLKTSIGNVCETEKRRTLWRSDGFWFVLMLWLLFRCTGRFQYKHIIMGSFAGADAIHWSIEVNAKNQCISGQWQTALSFWALFRLYFVIEHNFLRKQ